MSDVIVYMKVDAIINHVQLLILEAVYLRANYLFVALDPYQKSSAVAVKSGNQRSRQ